MAQVRRCQGSTRLTSGTCRILPSSSPPGQPHARARLSSPQLLCAGSPARPMLSRRRRRPHHPAGPTCTGTTSRSSQTEDQQKLCSSDASPTNCPSGSRCLVRPAVPPAGLLSRRCCATFVLVLWPRPMLNPLDGPAASDSISVSRGLGAAALLMIRIRRSGGHLKTFSSKMLLRFSWLAPPPKKKVRAK